MNVTYTYQVSDNKGRTWRTVAVGLDATNVEKTEKNIQRSGIIGKRHAERDRDYRFTRET